MGYFRRRISRQRCAAQIAGAVRRYAHDPASWQPVPARPPDCAADTYLRFTVGEVDPDARERLGVFQASYELRRSDRIESYDRARLLDLHRWFGKNLIAPRVPSRAIFWLRAEARACVERIWEMIWILRDYDLPVWMMRSGSPGRIVYRDDLQVAAVPHRTRHWLRRPV